jgi:hypothetical protein
MTKFNKDQFQIGKGYKAYTTYCLDQDMIPHATGAYPNYLKAKFVARFRVGGVGSFVTFLIKNFTVEEYFARMDAGESPLDIAESKGYMLPHIKKWLKRDGYPTTQAGYAMWRTNQDFLRQVREGSAA